VRQLRYFFEQRCAWIRWVVGVVHQINNSRC
jgi:hypothetical protein